MSIINPDRMKAQIDGSFVVFLIGMRINKPLNLMAWVPLAQAMHRMLEELHDSDAQSGFLGHTDLGFFTKVEYWRSFDALAAYSQASSDQNWPAWQAFNRGAEKANPEHIGIWHEAYQVEAGAYDTLYRGMPPHGLGRCGNLVHATQLKRSARRTRR
ncbi:MAG: DUF4188 domain-containing protein [Pseudomonadota bacterium]